MNGGKECSRDRGGGPAAMQIPVGWDRRLEEQRVAYISPSGTVLSSVEQVRMYLLTEGACKCGLECPLIVHKVFTFDPAATVKHRTAEDVKADEDVTKLCNHKRKIVAMATLHKSLESPHPSLALSGPTTGGSCSQFAETPLPGMMMTMSKAPHSLMPEYKSALLSKLMGAPGAVARSYQPEQPPGQRLAHRQRHGSSDCRQHSPCPRPQGEAGSQSPRLEPRTCSAFNSELHPIAARLQPRSPSVPSGLPQKPQAMTPCVPVAHPHPPPAPRSPKSPAAKISRAFAPSPETAAAAPSFAKPCGARGQPLGSGNDPLALLLLRPASASPESASVYPPLAAGRASHGIGAARSPQGSRHLSVSSSDPGCYVLQPPCVSSRPPSRSPRSLSSPVPSLPPSPTARPEGLLQPCPVHPGLPLSAPHPSSPSAALPDNLPQPGLLGMPLNQIFSHHNAAFFPASSLLSAAAKAQLASRSKLTAGDPGATSTLPNGYPLPGFLGSAAATASGGGGGRAGPPQKDPSRKRKPTAPTVLSMLKQSHGWRPEADPSQASQLLYSLRAPANGGGLVSVSAPPSFLPRPDSQPSGFEPSLTHLCTQSLPVGDAEGASCQSISTNLIPGCQQTGSPLLGLVALPGPAPGSSTPLLKVPASALLVMPDCVHNVGNPESTSPSASVSVAGTKTTSLLDPAVIVTTTVNESLPGPLTLGESCPFGNQVLPFGQPAPSSPGLPGTLNPNLLGPLPISLAVGQQQALSQNPVNLLPGAVDGQGDIILTLLGLLNPNLHTALSPNSSDLDGQTLQALQILMAALLQNHSPTAILPLPPISLPLADLTQQQQQPGALSSVLQFPTLQDQLSGGQTAGHRQEGLLTGPLGNAFGGPSGHDGAVLPLLFPTSSSVPAWLGLNPQLLATVLSSSSDNGTSPPQVCLSAVPLGSTATTCTTASPNPEGSTVLSVGESLLPLPGHGKINTVMPQLLNPLLGASLLGDMSALNSGLSPPQLPGVQTMLSSNPWLLQQQQPLVQSLQGPLGIQMFPSQTPLTGQVNNHTNPLACLFQNVQLTMGQAVMVPGKMGSLPDGPYTSPAPSHNSTSSQLPSDPSPSLQRKPEGMDPCDGAPAGEGATLSAPADLCPASAFSTTSAFTRAQPGWREGAEEEGAAGRSTPRPSGEDEGPREAYIGLNGEISGHNGRAEEWRKCGRECVNGQCGTDTGGPAERHGHRIPGCDCTQPGQDKGGPFRSGKHGAHSNAQHPRQQKRGLAKMNPETVKTLSGTLDGSHRTRKRSKNTPKISSNLEVALQEAMMELDQITANAEHQTPKEKLRKPMKSKQRKIVR
uniref:methyl-CpG-binding domain protein 5-like n=1 Tax=Pristiophorus japonicus TaxID=55135 RepID=UPI00398E9C7D